MAQEDDKSEHGWEPYIVFFLFYLAQIENSIVERIQNITNPAETMQPK